MTNEVATNKSQAISYEASGQEIKLSPSIVTQFITKGDGNISEQEAINFMMLCKYAELNPYLNEAYLIKFGNKPAQMITSKEAFMKRAERQPTYKGNEAGIIVLDKNGEIVERKGTIKTKNEELLGGWAKVFRSDRDKPTYISINFEEFAKYKYDGTLQATWAQMPANMIRKSALVNALREAYPDQLGAMYTEDEPDLQETTRKVVNDPSTDDKTQDLLNDFKATTSKEEPEKAQEMTTEQTNKTNEEETENNDEEVEYAEFEEIEKTGEVEEEPEEIDWSKWTTDKIKEALDKKSIVYQEGAKRDELIAVAEMAINGGVIQNELL